MQVHKTHAYAITPTRGTKYSAGYDLYSVDECVVKPGERSLVDTGIRVVLPEGVYGRIAPRSSVAWKHGVQVGAGVIDPDYEGPLKVLIFNHDTTKDYAIRRGDRIAQLILEKFESAEVTLVNEPTMHLKSERAGGGFGSTGV